MTVITAKPNAQNTSINFLKVVGLLAVLLFCNAAVSAFAATPDRQKMTALLNAGEQAQLSHELPKAEFLFSKALSEAQNFGQMSPEVQRCESVLATTQVLQGKLDKAEPHCKNAASIAIDMRKRGLDEPESFVWLDDLSDAYEFASNIQRPEYCLAQCLMLRKTISLRHKNLASTLAAYGSVLMTNDKLAEASKNLQEAHAVSCTLTGADSKPTAKICLTLANDYRTMGNLKEAEKYCSEAESIYRARLGDANPVVPNVVRLHASLLCDLNNPKAAEKEIRKAMSTHKELQGEDIEYGYDLSCLARIYLANHRIVEAESIINSAMEIMAKHPKALLQAKVETYRTAQKIELALHHQSEASKYAELLRKLEPAPLKTAKGSNAKAAELNHGTKPRN